MFRVLAVAALLGLTALPVNASPYPNCKLVGWLDAIRLGSGAALTPEQRRKWMVQLMTGADLSDVDRTVRSTMPPAVAARVLALIANAQGVSRGRSSAIDTGDLEIIAKDLGRVACTNQPSATRGTSGAGGWPGRSMGTARRAPDSLETNTTLEKASHYASLVLPLAAIAAFAARWTRRKERRARRYVCVLPVRIMVEEEEWTGCMLDVSQGGCRLQSTARLPMGKLASISADPFFATGHVVWSGGGHSGLAFAQIMSAEAVMELRRMARRRTSRTFRVAAKPKEA